MKRAVLLLLVAGCAPPAPAGYDDTFIAAHDLGEQQALALTNHYRQAAGVPPMVANAQLHLAAGRHAAYLLENREALLHYDGLTSHSELPWLVGYVGASVSDRIRIAGFDEGWPGGEIVNTAWHHSGEAPNLGYEATASWLATLYHRVPLMRTAITHMGHASVTDAPWSKSVMNFGMASEPPAGPLLAQMPAPGAIDIPLLFDGLETPEPIAPPNGWPSGFPISVTVDAEQLADPQASLNLRIESSRVTVAGEPWSHVAVDPTNDPLLDSTLFLYTDDPLPPSSTIEVELEFHLAGEQRVLTWSFVTMAEAAEP